MNKINTSITNFEEYFNTADFVDHNGGYCRQHPEHDDIGIGQNSCQGNTYGQDDRKKSSAYFTVKITPTKLNRILLRNRIEYKCKLFYNCKLYGHAGDNYDLAFEFQKFIKSRYKNVANFEVRGEYPHKVITIICYVDVFEECSNTVEEKDAIC